MAVEPAFDETIHAPVRLRVCGLLRHVDRIDFAVLRDSLGISDTALSKHLKVLGDAGYVAVTKSASPTRTDARRLTLVEQTTAGRRAFDAHMAELRRIAVGPVPEPARQESPAVTGAAAPGHLRPSS